MRAQDALALLRKTLKASRREHDKCADDWYSCNSLNYRFIKNGVAACSCGADAVNQAINEALKATEPEKILIEDL
jgi:hypothetical protein